MSEETKTEEKQPDEKIQVKLGDVLNQLFTRIHNLEIDVAKLKKAQVKRIITP